MYVSREQTQAKLDRQAVGAATHSPDQTFLVPDRFEQCAAEFPDRAFIIYNNQTISYAEVNRQANCYAEVAKQSGLSVGDVAAVMVENRPEFFYAWLGLAKIGVVVALINTQTKGRALKYALEQTESKLLFLGSECVEQFESMQGLGWPGQALCISDGKKVIPESAYYQPLNELLYGIDDGNPAKSVRAGITARQPLFYLFTSGTTGLPKAAVVSHMRWLNVGESWNALLNLSKKEIFYCFLPLFHGAAGMSLASSVLASGAVMVLRRRFSASTFWDDVRRYEITTVQYIGEVCRYLVNRPVQSNENQHTLKRMIGAGMNASVWESFIKRFGPVDIYEGWGSTEANCGLINVDQKMGSCGRIPFKDKSNARLVKYDVERDRHIKDENGCLIECDVGEVGELIAVIIDIPGLAAGRFEGYSSGHETDRKILKNVFFRGDMWFRSGDLFTADSEDYFYFVDRIGDTFRWKSENVSTTELTEVLSAYQDAETVNAYGVSVPEHEGRAGMVLVELREESDFNPKVFFHIAVTSLPRYAIPLFVRVSRRQDITATFKLRKVDLQRSGYNPRNFNDLLFVLDERAETYSPYCESALEQLGIKAFTGS